MKVFYIRSAKCEYDYIRYDLLHGLGNNIDIQFYDIADLKTITYDQTPSTFVYGVQSLTCAYGSGSLQTPSIIIISATGLSFKDAELVFKDIELFVKNRKPSVIFYLSDEFGDLNYWHSLSKYTKLFFCHYNHSHYDRFDNVIQMPLGYVSNVLSQRYSLDIKQKPICDRKYCWSFIGQIKSDRELMCNSFEESFSDHAMPYFIKAGKNSWDMNNQLITQPDMHDIYCDSIFIPVGRGNHSLDCFRIYEAIVSGAIPVVVGDSNEINTTFYYNNNPPPFLHFTNWVDAANSCKKLLDDSVSIQTPSNMLSISTEFTRETSTYGNGAYVSLQTIQDDLLKWWRGQITGIQHKISDALLN